MLGVICGIAALVFVESVYRAAWLAVHLRNRFKVWPPLMPLGGGVLLALLILIIPTDYLGLSLPLMDRALAGEPMPYLGFFWKSLFVAITVGSGFYGGIVTPQFVIGAVAGSAFAQLLGIDPMLGAAVGLSSVVAATSNTPVAAILMGVELLGGSVGVVYIAGAAITAHLTIGHRSIYPEQRLAYSNAYETVPFAFLRAWNPTSLSSRMMVPAAAASRLSTALLLILAFAISSLRIATMSRPSGDMIGKWLKSMERR